MGCLLAQASRLRKMQGVDYPIGNVLINRKKNTSKKNLIAEKISNTKFHQFMII
jgi:hypothetical protein